MTVGSPDPTAVEGWWVETPIRAQGSPANLWVHIAGLSTDWAGFPTNASDEWRTFPGIVTVDIPAGDTVLAGQGSLGISGAHRQRQDLLDTDDWGMALDNVASLRGRFDGPGTLALQAQFRTLGACWPVGVAVTVDLLVLRPSLIPATPLPYGQRPPRNRLLDQVAKQRAYMEELASLSARTKVLKSLLREGLRDEGAAVFDKPPREPVPSRGLGRGATVGLTMTLSGSSTPSDRPPHGPRKSKA